MDGANEAPVQLPADIQFGPYSTAEALPVFEDLNLEDLVEQQIASGVALDNLDMFANWTVNGRSLAINWLFRTAEGEPFAIAGLAQGSAAGVGQAAFLSRDPQTFRRPLVKAARIIRTILPEVSRDTGLRRIECRCWRNHSTASRFLESIGFERETGLRGFGPSGDDVFLQYAWLRRS